MLGEFQREEALIHLRRGLVLEQANRVEEAVEEYRRAIARDPHLREAHDALACYYQRHGLFAKAADEFRIVANLEDDFLSHFNLGYMLQQLGRYDEAMDAFRRCLALDPDDPSAHYEIACIHFARGEYRAALEQLQSPLYHHSQDWEIYHLLGACRLRLGAYDEALAAFETTLALVPWPQAQAQVLECIRMVERYREVAPVRCAKDQLYAEHGVVYLGSAQDDGLTLHELSEYHFTYPDIATSLQRLLALRDRCGWQLTCVVALDRLAQPLAVVLAELLGLPYRFTTEVHPDDRPLLVLAVGREAELLNLARERIPGAPIAFCLGLNWLRHSRTFPDITAVVANGACSVPWESELRRLRSDGAQPEQIARCLQQAAAQIHAALCDTTPDANLAEQVRYYRQQHRRLRFAHAFAPSEPLVAV